MGEGEGEGEWEWEFDACDDVSIADGLMRGEWICG